MEQEGDQVPNGNRDCDLTQSRKENEDIEVSDVTYKVPDGGWGWLCVAGCTYMHLLLGGLTRSYGVVYLEFRSRYGSSAAVTAWVGGLSTALRMGCSPIATSLSVRFTARRVVIAGGLLIGTGCILSSFAPNIEYLFFSYGIVVGLGGSLIYSPGIVTVGQYFEKKRGTATGLSTAGSGLGAFSFPPLVELFFEHYGYFGAMLLFGAIQFNNCISGALYRPLPQMLHKNIINNIKPVLKEHKLKNDNNNEKNKNIHIETSEELLSKRPDHDNKNLKNSLLDNKYLKLSLLKNPSFVLFVLSLGAITTSYVAGQMLLPAHAEDQGIPRTKSVLLLSTVGITDMAARILSGFIFDSKYIKPIRRHLFNIAIFVSAITCLSWAMCKSFISFILVTACHGFFNGFVVSQRPVIVTELFGVENLSSSFGLTVFVQGAGILIGPAVAGYLKDQTGYYTASYIYCGAAGLLSTILFCAINITLRRARTNSSRCNAEKLQVL